MLVAIFVAVASGLILYMVKVLWLPLVKCLFLEKDRKKNRYTFRFLPFKAPLCGCCLDLGKFRRMKYGTNFAVHWGATDFVSKDYVCPTPKLHE